MTPYFAYGRGGKKAYAYYRCMSVVKADREACSVRSVRACDVEPLIVARLRALGQSRSLVDRVVKQARDSALGALPKLERDLASKLGTLAQLQQEAKNLVGVLGAGTSTRKSTFVLARLAELEDQQNALEADVDRLRTELTRSREKVVDAAVVQQNLAAFDDVWEKLTPTERKELLSLLLHEAVYDKAAGLIRLRLRHLPDIEPLLKDHRFDECLDWRRDANTHRTASWLEDAFPMAALQHREVELGAHAA